MNQIVSKFLEFSYIRELNAGFSQLLAGKLSALPEIWKEGVHRIFVISERVFIRFKNIELRLAFLRMKVIYRYHIYIKSGVRFEGNIRVVGSRTFMRFPDNSREWDSAKNQFFEISGRKMPQNKQEQFWTY